MISQLEQSLTRHIELRQQVIIELISSLFQLHLSKMSEIVVGLSDQLFSSEEGVDQ
jgi:hypothetical protein